MTRQELNHLRELQSELHRRQRKLATLEGAVTNLTSLLDGMPRSREHVSKVEKLALKIVEAQKEIAGLKIEMLRVATELISAIRSSGLTEQEEQVLLSRYVMCKPIQDIMDELELGERRVYKLLSQGEKKLKVQVKCRSSAVAIQVAPVI